MAQSTTFPGLSDLSNAIAQAEGYGVNNAIPTIANNPGNIAMGDLGSGTLGHNISVYPDTTSGWNALTNQLTMIGNGQSNIYNPSMSLSQMGNLWAGGGTGSQNWVNNVAKFLGVDPNSTVGSILLGNPSQASSTDSSSSGAGTGLGGLLQQQIQKASNYIVGKAIGTAEDVIFSSRLIMLWVGIILIAAGVFTWKGSQIIEVAGGTLEKRATKVAEARAAEAAAIP